ncbi:hypothetical protein NSE01_40710 [Novosphingobium sediminis]|uniref:Uncharacterized protein n=1 Tax=Novosphingobium sediminis TaxID=707214 RepID=A0A512AR94_9SPHN|nr:hypothetical protein NSE01_40710 [Novosphingobium sediminis]
MKACTIQASYRGTGNSLNASTAIAKARQEALADGTAVAIDDPNTCMDERFRLAQQCAYSARSVWPSDPSA